MARFSWIKPLAAVSLFILTVALGSKYFLDQFISKLNRENTQSSQPASVSPPMFYDSIPAQTLPGSAPKKPANLQKSHYTVELARFKRKQKAAKWAAKLRDKGYQAFVTPIQNSAGLVYYYVRIGVYSKQKQAESLAHSLQTATGKRVAVKKL